MLLGDGARALRAEGAPLRRDFHTRAVGGAAAVVMGTSTGAGTRARTVAGATGSVGAGAGTGAGAGAGIESLDDVGVGSVFARACLGRLDAGVFMGPIVYESDSEALDDSDNRSGGLLGRAGLGSGGGGIRTGIGCRLTMGTDSLVGD